MVEFCDVKFLGSVWFPLLLLSFYFLFDSKIEAKVNLSILLENDLLNFRVCGSLYLFVCFTCLNVETLDFKFLLKPKYGYSPCIVEEGPNRLLTGGTLQGDARLALFKLDNEEVLEYRVFIKADRVSPFDLAASWRAYQDNLRPSTVRGIPDVSIDAVPETGREV